MSVFRHSREIPASPASVFAAIQGPARLARCWGPDGFTNIFRTFEFRPDGTAYPNESEFLEIVPGGRDPRFLDRLSREVGPGDSREAAAPSRGHGRSV